MTDTVKTPAWYRQQAAETRDKASLMGGPYGVMLHRLAEQWDRLAQQVATMSRSDTNVNSAEIIDLDAYRSRRTA
jgi:hypothetical protein